MKILPLFLLLSSLAISAAAESLRVPEVDLEDQFGKSHRIEFPSRNPLLVAIADRHGASAMKGWIRACKAEFGTNLTYVGIADVREAPGFLKSVVRKKFKNTYLYPILLDWNGLVTVPLKAKKEVPGIYIIGCDGWVIARESGCCNSEKIQRLKQKLSSVGLRLKTQVAD